MYTYESMISELLGHDATAVESYFLCHQESIGKSIKILEHKIKTEDFYKLTEKEGRTLRSPGFVNASDVKYITRNDEKAGLGKHRLHTAGFFYMQEVAASLPAYFIDVKEGDIIFDMCAAPGGKSVQLADKLLTAGHKPGLLVSNEVNSSRIVALQHNLNRTGIFNSVITSMPGGSIGNALPEYFDHVLVDAPCSGEGTGFKSDAGTKWRRQETAEKMARIQKELISSAIKACKVGGSIVYSTCTLNPRENEFIIKYVLETFADSIELLPVDIENKTNGITSRAGEQILSQNNADKLARFWPHIQHTGGFFIAKFIKTGATTTRISDKKARTGTASTLDISQSLQTNIAEKLLNDYGIQIDPQRHFFVSSQKQVYLTTPFFADIHSKIYSEKTGVPIFKWNNNKELRPLHGLGNCLGHLATKNTIILDDSAYQTYSEGYDISVPTSAKDLTGYVIIQFQHYGFSIGKIVDGSIKNKFMK